MSEVLRFKMEFLPEGVLRECVYAADFDRVTAERDAALAAEQLAIGAVAHNQLVIKELQQDLNQRDDQIATLDLQREAHLRNSQVVERRVDELQQRLTAADERARVLESAVALLIKVTPRNKSSFADKLRAMEILAALKPAEGGGDE